MAQFFLRRWFLILLAVSLVSGMALCDAAAPLVEWTALRSAIVVAVLFLMALPLEAHAVWNTVRRPLPAVLACAVTYGAVPLIAWGLAVLFGGNLLEEDLARGLLIAAATPCTLASASVWTRRAGGNDSIAILVTVVTNGSCFLVMPFWLTLTIGEAPNLDPLAMVGKLALIVVLPMAVAQCLRVIRPLAGWATAHKVELSSVAQCGILAMVFLGAIRTGQTLAGFSLGGLLVAGFVLLAVVIGLHLAALGIGYRGSLLLGLAREDSIAVGFAGSQKTLMIGLQTALALQISILPMVAYHICQLFIDTLIADRWRREATAQGDS